MHTAHGPQFGDTEGLRTDLEAAILAHAGLGREGDADTASLLRVIGAAGEAITECEALQRTSVHQARRSGIPWSDIGAGLGISRQAAQQRFAPEETSEKPSDDTRQITGATAFNEMSILEAEGRAGYHLVGFGPLFLTVQASDRIWEHRRIISRNVDKQLRRMEAAGWTYVGSWFPFHYFKRIAD